MGARAMDHHLHNNHHQQQVLPRQGSVYNLTLNEVQDHLGEPLLSMNLDDLLRNVLPPEETDQDHPIEELDLQKDPAAASASGIQRQGSVTITGALGRKTVDEVWRDIQRGRDNVVTGPAVGGERQATFGEMTLEDFLLKAGVVAEGWGTGRGDDGVGQQDGAAHWLQQQYPRRAVGAYGAAHPPMPLPLQAVAGGGAVVDVGYVDHIGVASPIRGTQSDLPAAGRKRASHGDIVEKTVERRQKRMIKNRESAARSRARKQAYTNELENKVSRLEEENELLKKQQELDRILYSTPVPEPKFRLRRTSSSPL